MDTIKNTGGNAIAENEEVRRADVRDINEKTNIIDRQRLIYRYSFYPRTRIQWNLLPIHIHEAATVDAFKALIPVTVLTPIYHV